MAKRASGRVLDGILLLDKPARIGSNAVLQHAKRLYGAARAGHTGTLDPMASGLLIVCFGEATKFAGELLDASKSYRAQVTLGVTTSTADSEGSVLEERPVRVDDARVEAVLSRFRGPILQVPPMHSALKRGGRPLYDYARRGETVARAARAVTVHALEMLARTGSFLELAIDCSKGTYVRTLAEDIGAAIGCGAHLSGLTRTALGGFTLAQAHTLDAIAALDPPGRDRLLLPTDRMLSPYPEVSLAGGDEILFRQGRSVQCTGVPFGQVRVYGDQGAFLGTGTADPAGQLRPKRLLAQASGERRDEALSG